MVAENQKELTGRNVDVERKELSRQPRGHKTICIPLDQEDDKELMDPFLISR